MVDWTRLAGKTWEALNAQGERGSNISRDDIDFLDYQILQWYDKLPNHAKLPPVGSDYSAMMEHYPSSLDGTGTLYIPAVLYLRKAHLRNLTYRLVLSSSARISQNKQLGLVAVQIAKEAIQTLFDLEQGTKVIATQQIFFAHLLLTAFGNLLLAVVNAMSEFWDVVRDEFYIALGLIRRMSTRSVPLMRLWCRIRGLEDLQAKMLAVQQPQRVSSNHQRQEGVVAATTVAHASSGSNLASFTVPGLLNDSLLEDYTTVQGSYLRDEFVSLFDTLESDPYSDFPFVDFTSTL